MIAIVKYGMGNIGSIMNALDFLGSKYVLTDESERILNATKIILPGVGAFNTAMKRLNDRKLNTVLEEAVNGRGIPLLGVCLGMQLLASVGEENETVGGLGFIEGTVRNILDVDTTLKVPHIGFNSVHLVRDSEIFAGLEDGTDFYFVHSYFFDCENSGLVTSFTDYGLNEFTASVQKENVFGVQFHPEKSQSNGLKLLKNFIAL